MEWNLEGDQVTAARTLSQMSADTYDSIQSQKEELAELNEIHQQLNLIVTGTGPLEERVKKLQEDLTKREERLGAQETTIEQNNRDYKQLVADINKSKQQVKEVEDILGEAEKDYPKPSDTSEAAPPPTPKTLTERVRDMDSERKRLTGRVTTLQTAVTTAGENPTPVLVKQAEESKSRVASVIEDHQRKIKVAQTRYQEKEQEVRELMKVRSDAEATEQQIRDIVNPTPSGASQPPSDTAQKTSPRTGSGSQTKARPAGC